MTRFRTNNQNKKMGTASRPQRTYISQTGLLIPKLFSAVTLIHTDAGAEVPIFLR